MKSESQNIKQISKKQLFLSLQQELLKPTYPTSPAAAAAAKSLQSCPTLCDPIDGSPPGSSVPGILQARILEWIAISFSNSCMHAKSLQSYSTLCDPMDRSLPGSSVQGILQARILEWIAMPSSRRVFPIQGSNPSLLRLRNGRQIFYHQRHLGRPYAIISKYKCIILIFLSFSSTRH